MTYTLTDTHGAAEEVTHKRHGFAHHGQRYERVLDLMPKGCHHTGIFRSLPSRVRMIARG
jgi:hypothetical protein